MLSYVGVFHLNQGYEPRRLPSSAHPSLYPSQVFKTRDDYVVIMCFKEKFWQRLCERVGLSELVDEPRFRRFSDRLEHRDELLPILQERLLERTTAEWLERLQGQVPCAPVNTVGQALEDEQVLARDMVIEVPSEQWGSVRQTGNPIKLSCAEPRKDPAPALGQQTDHVLANVLGYPSERIDQLRSGGVI
jgi:crotonobetainyl-CoA:carnitine CoA-transferase CaiB-like acyl-CoA transferase